MTLETSLEAFNNSGIVTHRGSGHSTQEKLMEMTEDWWLGALVEWTGTANEGRLARTGNPLAGVIVGEAFPELVDVTVDSDDKKDITGNSGRDAYVNVEPIQKGTRYVITAKTNTAIPANSEIQADLGYAIPVPLGVAQISTVQTVADVAGSLNDTYFLISAIDANGDQKDFYVWMNINAAGTDPDLDGRTGVEVAGATGISADDLATAIQVALDAITEFGASVSTDTVTVTNANKGECTDPVDSQQAATGFTIATTTQGEDYGDNQTPMSGVGGILTGSAITATADTEKLFVMEGR